MLDLIYLQLFGENVYTIFSNFHTMQCYYRNLISKEMMFYTHRQHEAEVKALLISTLIDATYVLKSNITF